MYKEISLILENTPLHCPVEEVKRLVYDENILHKSSIAGRRASFYHLKLLYTLDNQNPLFSAFRFFWTIAPEERPVLALESALARDFILRNSAQKILPLGVGDGIAKDEMLEYITQEYGLQFSPKVVNAMSTRLLTSWAQSGHLSGKVKRIRTRAIAGPASLAYALFLGQLSGVQGTSLFETVFVEALDATETEIRQYLYAAMKKGWLLYRNAGGIIELTITLDLNGEVKKNG